MSRRHIPPLLTPGAKGGKIILAVDTIETFSLLKMQVRFQPKINI